MTTVKTRFAPSPTGFLHVGGLRTALYAYLFAKKYEGIFLLRIEDTDQKRYVEGAVENLMNSLQFFDLQWDEGPYFQSERTEIYRKHANTLLENGGAYRCFCSTERLETMREEQARRKQTFKYDRTCFRLSPEEIAEKLAQNEPFVIRQRIPQDVIVFHDHIRGKVRFDSRDVDDQVLIKSDGFPTYHLANVVDDHEMEITHVIRGEEWLPSTPKHIWLYQAFGWTPPEFAHLPLLLNPDKSKLSKRQGDVAAEAYIQKGYLKEAMINFIALLGWNPGTEQEIFSREELIQAFDLDRVNKAGAVFNLEKLDWLNGLYIRAKSPKELGIELLERLKEEEFYKNSPYAHLTEKDLEEGHHPDAVRLLNYIACVQSRMKTLNDGPDMLKPFLLDRLDHNLELFIHEKMHVDLSIAQKAIEASIPALEELHDYSHEEAIKGALTQVIHHLGLKNGQVLWPLRVALSNAEYSPGVFEIIQVMGKELTLKRLKEAHENLKNK